MKYYGFMVCEFDGTIENLEGDFDWKSSHESYGFSFAKWFKSKNERDKSKEYIAQEINKLRHKS